MLKKKGQKVKKIKAQILCLIIATAFFAGLVSTTPSAYGIATVRVDPPDISATLYDTVSINIAIDNVESMYGYEFKLYWNTSILQCTQWNYTTKTWIQDPSTPPWPSSSVFVALHKIDDMPDGRTRYWIVLTALSPASPVSGSFTVATLSFNVTGVGETSLDLSDTVLGNQIGIPISHNIADGFLRTFVHDVAVLKVQPDSYSIIQNSSVRIEVEVVNYGNVPESFTVSAYYNKTDTGVVNAIGVQNVENLAVMAKKKILFLWKTTDVDGGFYQIFANTSLVEDEFDPSNNQLIDGIIEVASEVRHDVAIAALTANTTILAVGEIASIEVVVINQGIIDENNLSLTVYYNSTLLEKVSVPVIYSGSTERCYFNWSTADKLGDYSLRANVTLLQDETNTTNNERTIALVVTQTPIAEFTISPVEPSVNQKVTFNASASYDPDGSIVDYAWDFGDNTYPSYGVVVKHGFSKEGTFEVRLTVTDNKGLTYIKNRTLTYSSRTEGDVTAKVAASGIPQVVIYYSAIGIIFFEALTLVSLVYLKILRKPKLRK